MSILIKGIDLPKDGDFILLKVFPDRKTRIGLSTNYTQAIQIDRPHGRLIDADKVFTYDKIAEDQLKEVPTILEEEE